MTSSMPSLSQSLRRLAAARHGGQPVVDHPAFERLVAYHEGQLSPGEEVLIRDHLMVCPLCPALVLELDDLGRSAAAPGLDGPKRPGGQAIPPAGRGLAPTSETARWASWQGQRGPVVAGLALGVGLLLVAALAASGPREREGQARMPPAGIQVATISGLRGGAQPVTVRGDRYVLAFPELMPSGTPILDIEVMDGAGRSIWRGHSARGDSQQPVAVELSRGFLPAGTYSFVISEVEGGNERRQLGHYEVELSYG